MMMMGNLRSREPEYGWREKRDMVGDERDI